MKTDNLDNEMHYRDALTMVFPCPISADQFILDSSVIFYDLFQHNNPSDIDYGLHIPRNQYFVQETHERIFIQ